MAESAAPDHASQSVGLSVMANRSAKTRAGIPTSVRTFARNPNLISRFTTYLVQSIAPEQAPGYGLRFTVAGTLALSGKSWMERTGPTLDAGEFVSNSGGIAGDADDFLLYDSDTGNLYYDADGNGAGARILIASLTGAPPIGPTDILII